MALVDWLVLDGARQGDIGGLLEALCGRLNGAGVPVSRSTTHVQTLHPQFRSVMRIWRHGERAAEIRPRHGDEMRPAFTSSPVRQVWETGEAINQRLGAADDGAAAPYAIYAELRAQGLTHYLMLPIQFSDATRHAISFATDRSGGFSDRHVAILEGICPALSLCMEAMAIRRVSTEVLRTYVGFEPSTRILSGEIKRGDTKRLQAAILLADLRGFTAASTRSDPEDVVALLNDYLDCIVPAVEAASGEVLKFIGDGVLAVFETRSGDVRASCEAALRASRNALAAVWARNAEPPAARPEPFRIGIALHHGEVAYGNIGSGARLDFTVIGRDVNLASRLQGLCSELGCELIMSASFAGSVDASATSLGPYSLKGVGEPEQVFTLAAGAARP